MGPLVVDQRVVNMEELEKDFSSEFGGWVHKGGSWRPTECKARVKVRIETAAECNYGLFLKAYPV